MPPFVIGYVNEFILIHHHPDMKTNDFFHFLQHGFRAGLNGFQMGKKIVGYFKADGLQDFGFRLDMVIQTRSFHPHMFRQVPHGSRTKSFLPEKF